LTSAQGPNQKKIGGSYKRPYTENLTTPDKIDENAFSIKGTIEGKNTNTTEENSIKFPYLDADFKKAKPDLGGMFTKEAAAAKAKTFNGGGANKVDAAGDEAKIPNGSEVIKDYQTIAYGKIPTRIAGVGEDIDFRSLLTEKSDEYKRAEKENYGDKNINKFLNFGNPGKLGTGEDRVDFGNLDKSGDRYDKINALDIGEEPADGTYDLIQLWFKAEDGSRVQFRGTVAGITDTFSPSWDSVKYNGRADQAYQYKTFERSLSFNFKVYATSRIEMMPIYKKLSYLASMTMPQYHGSRGYNGTLIKFRLGHLFKEQQAFIESLSYSMSDETPWDLNLDFEENPLGELPMGIDVSIGLKILPKLTDTDVTIVPELGSKVYDTTF
jgi:hypothetical protein